MEETVATLVLKEQTKVSDEEEIPPLPEEPEQDYLAQKYSKQGLKWN